MADWANLVSTAAAAAGLVAAAAQGVAAARAARRQKADRNRLTDLAQKRALESADIQRLGAYLFDDIGAVRVSDVVSDDRVRERTMRALARLTQFIGDEPPATPGKGTAPQPEKLSTAEFATAREEVLSGNVWNGLARMRRYLEHKLKATSPQLHKARMSAGQLVTAASKIGAIPDDAVAPLRYAVNVANKAIHGETVELDIALEALDNADYGLRLIASSKG